MELPSLMAFDAITIFVDHDVTKATIFAPVTPLLQLTARLLSIIIMYGNVSVSPINLSRIVVPNLPLHSLVTSVSF